MSFNMFLVIVAKDFRIMIARYIFLIVNIIVCIIVNRYFIKVENGKDSCVDKTGQTL